MQVVEVLNPLAREFKSVGTLRKDLAELQQELAKAHNQVRMLLKKESMDLLIEGALQCLLKPDTFLHVRDAGSPVRSKSVICT
jgi:hypothetical protein